MSGIDLDGMSVMMTMTDQAGIARVKLIPPDRVAAVRAGGASFSLTSALLLCADDGLAELAAYPVASGDVRLVPDMAAARVFDAAGRIVWAPADQFTPDGDAFPVCQRQSLRRLENEAREGGLHFRVAFEIEFTLFRDVDGEIRPAHTGPAYGLQPLLDLKEWSASLLLALKDAKIDIEQLHPEYGHGQMELALTPRSPVDAVDEYVATRMIIARVAHEHGLRVSFAPVPVVGGIGNGAHVHFSVEEDGRNVFAPDPRGVPAGTGDRLLGGLLSHLVPATALLAPSVNSYDRLKPGMFSGAYVCWGVENREAALRYIPGPHGREQAGANVELKTPDGSANPYTVTAVILAASMDGLDANIAAPQPTVGAPTAEDGAQRLPADLGEALDLLDASTFLRRRLGDDYIDSHIAVRRHEWREYADVDPEVRVERMRWNA